MRLSLSLQFCIWIIGGLALVIGMPFLASRTICYGSQIEQHHQTAEKDDDGPSDALLDILDEPIRSAFAQGGHQYAEKGNSKVTEQKTEAPYPLICDAKGTDLALVYFTYCLVIVGWFGLQSSEKNLEATERAYIFHGYSPLEFRNGQATFTLNMINAGRMPGGVTEVAWKFLPGTDLPETRDEIDWEILEYDFVLRPNIRWDIRTFLSFSGDNTFVSRIKYKDLFSNRDHVTYMGMHIYPGRSETQERTARAGGDHWNYWD